MFVILNSQNSDQRGHPPPETTGGWPTDPNLYQHNKPSVTVLNFNVCLIYAKQSKNSNDGCKNSSKVHHSKRFIRPNQSLTGVFPSRSTPTSCNTLLRTGCKHTGQAHWGHNRNVIHGHTPRQRYTRPGTTSINLQRPIKKELPSTERQIVRSTTLQISLGGGTNFLSLQHSYSKFGVFRTILPTNAATQKKARTEKF